MLVAIPVAAAPKPPKPAKPAPPGWTVDRVHAEPIGSAALSADGVGTYRGTLDVVGDPADGGVAAVNTLPLDDYLLGISEVPTAWPLEAQKAQAIAARTYALHEMAARPDTATKQIGADLCATDACQVYAGLAKEQRPGSETWAAAVRQTTNQVLWYRNAPINAKYSSSNGGVSTPGGEPYLQAVADPDDVASPLHQWHASYALPDVARAVGVTGALQDVHREGDQIVATSTTTATDGTDGIDVTTSQLRLALADFRSRIVAALPPNPGLPVALPSARFTAWTDPATSTMQIDGGGWGHGIGLSQYGALGKALRGMRAPDILAAYYAGLRPVTLPPQRLAKEVKVAVALGRPELGLSAGAADPAAGGPDDRFRLTDGDGHVLAVAATGDWRVVPAPKGQVRLLPPPEETAPPGAAIATVDPATPAAGGPLHAVVDLEGPAATTTLLLTRPDGGTQEVGPAVVRLPGPLHLDLAQRAEPGSYRLEVTRDAGGERAATTTLAIDVPAPASLPPADLASGATRAPAAPPGRSGVPWPFPAAAAAALAAAGAGLGTTLRGRVH